MMSQEALPIVGGAILGCIASYAYHRTRRWIYVAGVIVVALCATVASGEYRQSWGFLLDDVLIVLTSAGVAFLVSGLIVRSHLLGRD